MKKSQEVTTFPGLPEWCHVVADNSEPQVVQITRGHRGYVPVSKWLGISDLVKGLGEEAVIQTLQRIADDMNRGHGVTRAQAAAMKAGSMFGWQCPASNPLEYDEHGELRIKSDAN